MYNHCFCFAITGDITNFSQYRECASLGIFEKVELHMVPDKTRALASHDLNVSVSTCYLLHWLNSTKLTFHPQHSCCLFCGSDEWQIFNYALPFLLCIILAFDNEINSIAWYLNYHIYSPGILPVMKIQFIFTYQSPYQCISHAIIFRRTMSYLTLIFLTFMFVLGSPWAPSVNLFRRGLPGSKVFLNKEQGLPKECSSLAY